MFFIPKKKRTQVKLVLEDFHCCIGVGRYCQGFTPNFTKGKPTVFDSRLVEDTIITDWME